MLNTIIQPLKVKEKLESTNVLKAILTRISKFLNPPLDTRILVDEFTRALRR